MDWSSYTSHGQFEVMIGLGQVEAINGLKSSYTSHGQIEVIIER